MRDRFFEKKFCDRCGSSLEGGRIMSMINTECICIPCCKKEKEDPENKIAIERENQEVLKGNYNYQGLKGR